MNRFLQRFLTPVLALLIVAFAVFFYMNRSINKTVPQESLPAYLNRTQTVHIGEARVDAWIVDQVQTRAAGLSVFENLDPDQGMLFVFDEPGIYSFWMKDMKFPIDIFWLNENKEVVFIKENAHPDDYPESYTPDQKALYVLETVAGFAEEHNVSLGMTLDF